MLLSGYKQNQSCLFYVRLNFVLPKMGKKIVRRNSKFMVGSGELLRSTILDYKIKTKIWSQTCLHSYIIFIRTFFTLPR